MIIILKTNMNKGELDEYMCILKLIEIRQNGGTLFSDKIISLKSNGIETK